MTLSPAEALEFARAWVDAWGSHDLERILAHYADPLDFTSPLILQRLPHLDGTIRDLATLRGYFQLGLQRAPELRFELIEVLMGVRGFCMYYVNARGGRTAEYVELDEHHKIKKAIVCYS